MNAGHLPNLLTIARIALVPPLLVLMHSGSYFHAFWIFVLAAISDVLDGALARRFGWESRLGGLLDPLADKFLVAAGFVGLWFAGVAPGWLLLLVLGRDLVIIAGAFAYQGLVAVLQPAPTRLGKLTTLVQLCAVLLGFGHLLLGHGDARAVLVVSLLVAAFTLASGLHYVVTWSRRAWQMRHAEKQQ
jgi:cardiolipin synthase